MKEIYIYLLLLLFRVHTLIAVIFLSIQPRIKWIFFLKEKAERIENMRKNLIVWISIWNDYKNSIMYFIIKISALINSLN